MQTGFRTIATFASIESSQTIYWVWNYPEDAKNFAPVAKLISKELKITYAEKEPNDIKAGDCVIFAIYLATPRILGKINKKRYNQVVESGATAVHLVTLHYGVTAQKVETDEYYVHQIVYNTSDVLDNVPSLSKEEMTSTSLKQLIEIVKAL